MLAQQLAFTRAFIEETVKDPVKVRLSYPHCSCRQISKEKLNKICGNHIKKSVGSIKLIFSAFGL